MRTSLRLLACLAATVPLLPAYGEGDRPPANRPLRCTMAADAPFADLAAGKYPRIAVDLRWAGPGGLRVKWDADFGRVLWDRQLVLVAEDGGGRRTSEELRFKTSSTYPARRTVDLAHGTNLAATLDFTALPASYLRHLFRKPGPVILRVVLAEGTNRTVVSDGLWIHVR